MTKRLFSSVVFTLALTAAVRCSAFAGDFDPAALPNPLQTVRAGQWARYRVNTLFGTAEQRQSVVAVSGEGDDRVVTIKTEMSLDGEIVDSREEAATYRKLLGDQSSAFADAENSSAAECETEFGGASLHAVSVNYTQDGKNYTVFLSGEIPLSGVIRLVEEGAEEPVVELIDFSD